MLNKSFIFNLVIFPAGFVLLTCQSTLLAKPPYLQVNNCCLNLSRKFVVTIIIILGLALSCTIDKFPWSRGAWIRQVPLYCWPLILKLSFSKYLQGIYIDSQNFSFPCQTFQQLWKNAVNTNLQVQLTILYSLKMLILI
jgi:hypothetical protein